MQLDLQILILLFPACQPCPRGFSAFQSYDLITSSSLSVLSLPQFILLMSVCHLSLHRCTYIHSVCCQLPPLLQRTLTKTLQLYSISECHFLTRGDQAIGKLASAPSSLSDNASSFPIGCSAWFVLKEKISFVFSPLFLKSVLCYLARTSSFSCGLPGSGNNMVIFV